MILLDTNVVSETIRERPDPNVVAWLNAQRVEELHLCAPVIAELFYGIEKLPESRRKRELARRVSEMAIRPFRERVLPFDAAAGEKLGILLAMRERRGRPMQIMDAMIAAIALDRNARLATRNSAHFQRLDLDLINPFAEPVPPEISP